MLGELGWSGDPVTLHKILQVAEPLAPAPALTAVGILGVFLVAVAALVRERRRRAWSCAHASQREERDPPLLPCLRSHGQCVAESLRRPLHDGEA